MFHLSVGVDGFKLFFLVLFLYDSARNKYYFFSRQFLKWAPLPELLSFIPLVLIYKERIKKKTSCRTDINFKYLIIES